MPVALKRLFADTAVSDAFVLLRKPESNIVEVWLSDSGKTEGRDSFVFAPFSEQSETSIILTRRAGELSSDSIIELSSYINRTLPYLPLEEACDTQKSEFFEGVECLKNLCAHSLPPEKIVLSAIRHAHVYSNWEGILHGFTKLIQLNPTAMVSLFYHPEAGVWLGASPELLLKVSEGQAESMALAATKKAADRSDWKNKEKKEFGYVLDFIVEAYLSVGLEPSSGQHSMDYAAGNVRHMMSRINAQLAGGTTPADLVQAIHPSPAICGSPVAEAKALIEKLEKHRRKYFSGYLGIMGAGSALLYVNLRCAQIFSNTVRLYAGAGITAESDPESEWDEIASKMSVVSEGMELNEVQS